MKFSTNLWDYFLFVFTVTTFFLRLFYPQGLEWGGAQTHHRTSRPFSVRHSKPYKFRRFKTTQTGTVEKQNVTLAEP